MLVTAFDRMTIKQRLMRLWPAERRRQDGAMRAELRRLIENPSEPCVVSGSWIPHGYSRTKSLQSAMFGADIF